MSDLEDELSNELLQDFNTLIGGCQEISDEIEKSSEALRSLTQVTSQGLQVTSQGVPDEFDETLNELHKTALKNIKGKKKGNFGEMIMKKI